MKLRLSDPAMIHEYGKGWRISFLVSSDYVKKAQDCVDKFKGRDICVEPTEWKEHRTLSANAYFHVLVSKVAEAMNLGEEEVKENFVLNYGVQRRNPDGSPMGLMLPKGTDPHSLGIKYPKWFDTEMSRGITFDCWLVYEETHAYDTKQMARLIEGVIHEINTTDCLKHIDTIPHDALENLYVRTDQEIANTKAS